MKKLMVLCIVISTMLHSMCFAQSTSDVKSVTAVQGENKTQKFYAQTENGNVEISPLIYKIVEAYPQDFIVVEAGGVKTLFARVDFVTPSQYVFEVDNVTLENDKPTVTMTNGFKFSDEDISWLAVLPGQHVQVSRYIGLTREITVFETVSRDTPLTGDVTSANAPAKSKLPKLIEETKSRVKAALAMNSAPAEVASTPSGKGEIKFARR